MLLMSNFVIVHNLLIYITGQTTPEPDPCLSGNYQKLDQPDRSTAVKLQRGTGVDA